VTSSSTPTPAATAAAVAAAVSSAIAAAAVVLARAVVSSAGRIVLCGIVVRREILRRRSVRIGLAFVRGFGVRLILCGSLRLIVTFFYVTAFGGLRFVVRSMLFIKVMILDRVGLVLVRLVVVLRGASQCLTR
jgi:hypothetical protein